MMTHYDVSIPLRGFHVDNVPTSSRRIRALVSIPLRGFHVDNSGAFRRSPGGQVSIPLRGFHVDNRGRYSPEHHLRFNPLAGIPCGQRNHHRPVVYESCFNPLAGIPCGQRLVVVGGRPHQFQSPCGDSMWTTACKDRCAGCGGVSIPLRGFHVDNVTTTERRHDAAGFNPLAGIPCGQQRWRSSATKGSCFNPLAGIPCGQPVLEQIQRAQRSFNPLAGIPCGQRC